MSDRLRLVVMGDSYVGKSSVIKRFLFGSFPEKYIPTVEDLFSQDFELADTNLKVDILDTSGDAQFPAMRRLSISSAHAFLLVYSGADPNSFFVVKQRFEEIREERADYQDLPIVILANKSDLVTQVDQDEVKQWIRSVMPEHRSKWLECSALDNTNIRIVFKTFLILSKIDFAPKCGFASEDFRHQRNLSVKIKSSRSKSPTFLGEEGRRSMARSSSNHSSIIPRSRQGSSDSPSLTPATTPRTERKLFGFTVGSPFGSPKFNELNSNSNKLLQSMDSKSLDPGNSFPSRNSKRSRSLIRRSSKKVKQQVNSIQNVNDCSVS